jgi:hypothetical protein
MATLQVNRFNFLLSSGHVPSADCCLDIIMDDLANRVLFKLICILNAMIVDFMTRRLLHVNMVKELNTLLNDNIFV